MWVAGQAAGMHHDEKDGAQQWVWVTDCNQSTLYDKGYSCWFESLFCHKFDMQGIRK